MAQEAVATIRFQFPYMEDGKRRPDSPKLLEETWREVIQTAGTGHLGLVVGGRSMGGAMGVRRFIPGRSLPGEWNLAIQRHRRITTSTPTPDQKNCRQVKKIHRSVPWDRNKSQIAQKWISSNL